MLARGKFRSLTLVNWNGFFARTFDLDQLVTTLSGGNGAGKSTVMAAFVTALIPDLTLLHFRNTTEAGATTGSRDKGLHGKLKAGVCYAILDVINSRQQRILAGVRLQQIAGRDRKVDIKPFTIQGLPIAHSPTQIVSENVLSEEKDTYRNRQQVRVLSLPELKEKLEQIEGVLFKQFNSITEYHALLFDLGMIPKRLRSAGDRSKFYRLIEASLYGGISSAITRSLRDYLLPENAGVRKAFQDMEIALRENRMTLEAIRVTQSDRDLFKHLIAEATAYVAADYMRHANERELELKQALQQRKELFNSRTQLASEQVRQVTMARALEESSAVQAALEIDYQGASDYLNLVQNALRQQEKIERYQGDLEELIERLEEQNAIVAEAEEQQASCAEQLEVTENEVDELKSQLADYQQALNVQQTRTIQYQQALQALERARELCRLPDLSADTAQQWQDELQEKEQEVTESLLQLQQTLSMADVAQNQFEQAYALVGKLAGKVSRTDAWQVAKQCLQQWAEQRHQAEEVKSLRSRLHDIEQRLTEQREVGQLLQEFNRLDGGQNIQNIQNNSGEWDQLERLPALLEQLEAQQEEFSQQVAETGERRTLLQQELGQNQQRIELLSRQAPEWLAAQESLQQLREQCGQPLQEKEQLSLQIQQLLEQEREVTVQRDLLATRKQAVERQIMELSQPGGAEDSRLIALAERFGGVLLSEIYDDVTIEDAPYFSALYGPARHGIVVADLAAVREQLEDLADCPEDLYLIEGDPHAFDDSVFSANELSDAVVVKVTERQWRYSRFPEVPLFGRAARESQLAKLRITREELVEQYAVHSFDLQKINRLHQALTHFVGSCLAVAFNADPEKEIRELKLRNTAIARTLEGEQAQLQQHRERHRESRERLLLLHRIVPRRALLADETLSAKQAECAALLQQAEESARYLQQHQQTLTALEPLLPHLQSDPHQHEQLREQFQQRQQQQRLYRQQLFSLSEVVQRRAHFSYSDSVEMVSDNADLNNQLRQRLSQAEEERSRARSQLRQQQESYSQYSQLRASLKSSYETKNEMLRELMQELQDLGVAADAQAEVRATARRDELHAALNSNRSRCSQLEKQLTFCEAEMDALQKKLRRIEQEYVRYRQQVVQTKAGWCSVMRVVKNNNIERRLHRRELAYQSRDELRSISDKALGALRLAVADNEHLRDILRLSEDSRYPEKKIEFYLAVYRHLRERIRQDIIRTDDPIEAIEQMEIELARLTEELTAREQMLAISSKSVANIIRKTIQREQNRIRMLNQGLQNVSFGQVKSVRLNVSIRETNAQLLEALADQHEQHQDLFSSHRLTFSEALARLYQRLNPQIDFGQRTVQTIGEELLDYRNYLELEVEVFRGSDGWLRAESGALSTGEAIGTGMSILVMVVQSWEEEARRLRSKEISPCRLLFLDEAARLDANSIATLFELCERLEMQLIIAAPENISPEKGTTYKLVRKVFNNSEHVHVVGLRGFAEASEAEGKAIEQEQTQKKQLTEA